MAGRCRCPLRIDGRARSDRVHHADLLRHPQQHQQHGPLHRAPACGGRLRRLLGMPESDVRPFRIGDVWNAGSVLPAALDQMQTPTPGWIVVQAGYCRYEIAPSTAEGSVRQWPHEGDMGPKGPSKISVLVLTILFIAGLVTGCSGSNEP